MSTTKSEYTQLCTEILDAVGGSKNIRNVFHCITRLRIVPVNRDAVDMDKLSKVSGILKVVESSGQIQCVIGTTVPEVYEEFLAVSGVAAGGAVEAEPATDDVPEKKPNIITRGLNTLASCVTPGLYAIVAGGMIKGVVSLLTAIGLVSSKSDIITVLNAVGDAPFYFMPFIIGYAAAKRFKVKEIFGIMTAGILMYSTFLSPKEGITGYAFGPINIPAYNYKGSIFPVILSVWIFSIIFHLIDKHMPKNLRIVFSGALSFRDLSDIIRTLLSGRSVCLVAPTRYIQFSVGRPHYTKGPEKKQGFLFLFAETEIFFKKGVAFFKIMHIILNIPYI